MSKLQELIQKFCPDGVVYRKLGNKCVSIMQRGTSLTKNNSIEGIYPVISGGRIPAFYCDKFNREGETITVAGSGAGAGYVQYWNEPIFVCDAFSIKGCKEVSTKYLYYCLTNLQGKIYATKKGGGVPHVHISSIENFLIPIPHIDIQEEIVNILDRFAEYATELQAELQARKEQYEYYKQTIFRSVSLQYKDFLLKEIATFSQGIQVDPNLQYDTMKSGRIRFLRIVDFVSNNEPYRYIEKPSNKYIKSDNELIMIRYGASAAGKVFMCHSGAIANNMFKINLKPEILPKYVMYYLSQNSIYTLLNSSGGRSTMPAINFKLVGSIHIPIPPYSEQQRIVSILDKFEILVNDLQQGLPAEINAVQEQYEYYRNKLLLFPRKIEHTIFS